MAAKKQKRPSRTRAKQAPARHKGPTSKPSVIDFHAHIANSEILAFAHAHSMYPQNVGGHGKGIPEEFVTQLADMERSFQDMDRMGVDMRVISTSILWQCTYFVEPHEALKVGQFGNDRIVEAVARYPDRLIGRGMIPLHDVQPVVQELNVA